MCGIFSASLSESQPYIDKSLLDVISHRGPDDQGWFVADDNTCQLGHVRLSIVDLSTAGHQPMSDSTGRYTIVFNGEIYNYLELKRHLEVSHASIDWKSSTDTEVILEGFAHEGFSFLSLLNGIFALSIYDRLEKALHVVRDPLGVKPLFFTNQNGCVYFCSELKGLLKMKCLKRTLSQSALADQLSFMYVPEPNTLFEEFKKMPPGICTTYISGKQISEVALFKHILKPIDFSSEAEMIETFKSTFSQSVKRQLMGDAPASIMLSGGLDSSAIAYEAVSQGNGVINDAYTIASSKDDLKDDQQGDDLRFARLVAKQLGIKLHVIPAHSDFLLLLPQLSQFLEDGISDPAAINSYLICKAANEAGTKVILNGQGADEFLAGYRRYSAERMISKWPSALSPIARYFGDVLPHNLSGRFNSFNRRLKRLLSLAGMERNQRLLDMYTWAPSDEITSLFKHPERIPANQDLLKCFDEFGYEDIIDTMMQVDHKYDLMSLNLAYTDRMSMATGVEARVPFLDFDLLRVMNSIPSSVKMKKGIPKYVLKKAMEPHLPKEVVYRSKAGFGSPLRAWMKKDSEILRHYFSRQQINKHGIFNANHVLRLFDNNLSGKGDYSNVLFSMLCIQVWLDSLDGLANI